MKQRLCPVTGKRQYKNAGEAKRVIAQAERQARDTGVVAAPLSCYRGLCCDRWHLTHYAPEETREFKARDRIVRAFRKFARNPRSNP